MCCTQSHSQQNKNYQLIPGKDGVLPALNVYDENTGELVQYFVEDAKWVKNTNVPSISTSFKKGTQKIQYFAGNNKVAPGLFVYSSTTAQFEFYYLNDKKWVLNDNLPKGAPKFKSSDIKMKFSPANDNTLAFIFAHSTNGQELKVLEINDGVWTEIDYFPGKL